MTPRAFTPDELGSSPDFKDLSQGATGSPVGTATLLRPLRFVCSNCHTENEDGFCNGCGHFAFEVAA